MFRFPAQYNSHRGPDVVGSHHFHFDVDESIIDQVGELMKTKKGTQFIMTLKLADGTDKDLVPETPGETLLRFRKRFHALINEVATYKSMTPEKVKTAIRSKLIKEGKIKESTKEMDIAMLSVEINNLEEIIK